MLADEVITIEQSGVLATETAIWGHGGAYLRHAIRDVDTQAEWYPRFSKMVLWLLLTSILAGTESLWFLVTGFFLLVDTVDFLLRRRVVVRVGEKWRLLAKGLPVGEARDLARAVRGPISHEPALKRPTSV